MEGTKVELDRIDLLHARYGSDLAFKSQVRYLLNTFSDSGRLVFPSRYYAKNRDAIDLVCYRLNKGRR